MSKRNVHTSEEPQIVRVYYGKDGRQIGAAADNDVVSSREDAERILENIAEIYGDLLRRKAEAGNKEEPVGCVNSD